MDQSERSTTTIDTMFEPKRQRLEEEDVWEKSSTVIGSGNVPAETEVPVTDVALKSSTSDLSAANVNRENIDWENDNIQIISEMLNSMLGQLQNGTNCITIHTAIDERIEDVSDIDTVLLENVNDEQDFCSLTNMRITTMSVHVNRPQCTKVCLPGVEFISDLELAYVDQQRFRLDDEVWLPTGSGEELKPSKTWFTPSRSKWLRAVHSSKKYGLLCVICAKEAKDKRRILQNQGSFICRPYWKLLHQGLEGITD